VNFDETRSCIVITSPRYVVQGCTACFGGGNHVKEGDSTKTIAGVHD
jgi:hypothetical protein